MNCLSIDTTGLLIAAASVCDMLLITTTVALLTQTPTSLQCSTFAQQWTRGRPAGIAWRSGGYDTPVHFAAETFLGTRPRQLDKWLIAPVQLPLCELLCKDCSLRTVLRTFQIEISFFNFFTTCCATQFKSGCCTFNVYYTNCYVMLCYVIVTNVLLFLCQNVFNSQWC